MTLAEIPQPTVTIELPYVMGGPPSLVTDHVYDDSVDVTVEQGALLYPCANLRLNPGGPCEFILLGFSTAGLRELAAFLVASADEIEERVNRYNVENQQ